MLAHATDPLTDRSAAGDDHELPPSEGEEQVRIRAADSRSELDERREHTKHGINILVGLSKQHVSTTDWQRNGHYLKLCSERWQSLPARDARQQSWMT